MKKANRILLLLLIAALLLGAVSCTVSEKQPIETTGSDPGSANGTPEESTSAINSDLDPEPILLKLSENKQSAFVVIYSEESSDDVLNAAVKLRTKFDEYTGASIKLKTDFLRTGEAAPADAYEILVGQTNRPETAQALSAAEGTLDYVVAVVGNKLVLSGNSETATINAVYYFINKVLAKHSSKNESLVMSSAQNYIYIATYPAQNFTILGNTPKEYALVLANEPTFSEWRFAKRLQYLIASRAGKVLPILSESESSSGYEILIGQTTRTKSEVGDFEYALTAKDNRVEILADSAYGYEYLYDYCVTKFFSLVSKGQPNGGDLCRISTVESIKESQTESLLGRKGTYRFMQFNIQGEERRSRPYGQVSRQVAEVVGVVDPDILLLNEYNAVPRKTSNFPLADVLAERGYAMVDGGKQVAGQDTTAPIFYRTSLFELVVQDYFKPKNWDSGECVTACILRNRSDGKQLIVVNFHLSHETDEATDLLRVEQMKEVFAAVNKLKSDYDVFDVLISGDMNCHPSGSAYVETLNRGYRDVHDLADISDNTSTYWNDPTYNENIGVFESPKRTGKDYSTAVDHTFFSGSGLTFKRFDILTDTFTMANSDHAPTVIDFDMDPFVIPDPYTGEYSLYY